MIDFDTIFSVKNKRSKSISSSIYCTYFSADMIDFLKSYGGLLPQRLLGFRGIESSPWSSNGVDSINNFISLTGGQYSIDKYMGTYLEQIPTRMIVIGESEGGNLILFSKDNKNIYFWDHDSTGLGLSKIAEGFQEWVDSLFIVDEKEGGGDNRRTLLGSWFSDDF